MKVKNELLKEHKFYKSRSGKPGARPSTHTWRMHGFHVQNTEVLNEIRCTLEAEFCCYGYRNVTSVLRDKTYLINHKKVYWIMDENKLLLGNVISTNWKRCFVQHRRDASSTCGLRAKNATITYWAYRTFSLVWSWNRSSNQAFANTMWSTISAQLIWNTALMVLKYVMIMDRNS